LTQAPPLMPLVAALPPSHLPLSASQPPIPLAPALAQSLAAIVATVQMPPALPAQVSQVAAAAPGGIEPTSTVAKFDKSDEVLFKAQDEFLRRLKEKSAKGSKPSAPKPSVVAGMSITLPPKPAKSPPLSLSEDAKEEKHTTDVDMRLKNVDLKKLSQDIDKIMKQETTKRDMDEGLAKSSPAEEAKPSLDADAGAEGSKTQDVDMRKDKGGEDARGGEPKRKRLSIVRPPPSVVSRPSSHVKEESEANLKRRSSTSADGDSKRKFEGQSSDGVTKKESHGDPRNDGRAHGSESRREIQGDTRGDARESHGERESVWRRLSAESYSHRDAKEGRGIDKDDVRRYSEMCDNYYRTYYEEQYGNKGKRHGGGDGGGSSSDGGRRHDDGRRYDDSDEDRRWTTH